MKNIIKRLGKVSLSGDDIYKALNKKVKVITYADLSKYKTIDQLLKPHDQVVILYETSQGYGHWVALYKSKPDTITFFDSYGLKPDKELKFVPKYFRHINETDYPLLSLLLYNSGYKIEYNEYKLQKELQDVNTCGRHVIIRLQNKSVPIKTYAEILNSLKPLSPDDLVILLTANIHNLINI